MADLFSKLREYAKTTSKYLPSPPLSPDHSPSASMSFNNNLSKHETSRSTSNSDPTSAFDNVTQTPVTGRLSVTIVEGRKLNVSNFQARPYCVVEFDRNEFVTREAIRDCDVPSSRNGKIEFLDLVRAATSPVWKQKAVFDVARLDGEVHVLVYERVPDHTKPEVFLGMLKIQPPKNSNTVVDNWFKLLPRGNKETVTGELRVQISYEKVEIEKSHLKPSSFEILKLIGKGNFGKVFQVRKKDTNRIYAMKVLHKQDLIERREVEHTLAEKNILIQAEACPFLVGLKFSFQTRTHLYLVTDFMNGGELFWHLQNEIRLSEERAKFYAAEIVLALEHLHKYNIVYRDLKPENILLDATGHIALCDFGLCKENLSAGQTTNTFCGTSEYLAPEVLVECGYNQSVDWWSLGILFYEMIAGFSPFYTNDTQLMYRKILFGKLKFPKGFFSEDAKSLIKGLLARNPHNRLGSRNDAEEIKNHPFFANVDWDALYLKQVSPPYKPNVSSEDDTSCFDPSFTEEETNIENWPSISKNLSRNGTNASINNEIFGGFTYSGENSCGLSPYGDYPLELGYDFDIASPSSSSSGSGSWRNLSDAVETY
ncbi:Pkinase-domain-containing protein [Gigaspora margarita]|uniref:non-specific serine/threonine protein kinase n=1 Tax=Gigaspora margarita TaxID=4874 RepID=A0A8H4AYH2_GIGMA|nr:Pkinase-domain-containing protein [Gigaspora margarita]